MAPGEEPEFHAWAQVRLAESAEEPGYLGGKVLAPEQPGPDWYIVHRFQDGRAARRWEEWFARSPGAELAVNVSWEVEEPERASGPLRLPIQQSTEQPVRSGGPMMQPGRARGSMMQEPARGLMAEDPYADLPPTDDDGAPVRPRKWKVAVVTLGVVVPPVFLFNAFVLQYLQGASVVLRTAALCLMVVLVTTTVTTPRVTWWLTRWLNPLAGKHRHSRTGAPTRPSRGR